MTAFVAVHGVGHYRAALSPADIVAARSAVWAEDLAAGLDMAAEHVPVTYAYYAHHLHHGRPVVQGSEDLARLEREHPHLAEDITHWVESLDESLGLRLPPPATAQGRLAVPLRQLVSAVSERLSLDGRLTHAFIATFFRDVTRYLAGRTTLPAPRPERRSQASSPRRAPAWSSPTPSEASWPTRPSTPTRNSKSTCS